MERIEYKDILFEIADAVTMQDVLNQYGFPVKRARGRIPCPFHNGKNDNLGYSEHKFSCFVCGEHGNPISFVAKLYGETTSNAAQRIDQDFGLNMYGKKLSYADYKQIERKKEERKAKLDNAKKLEKSYVRLCDLNHALEKAIKCYIKENAKTQEVDKYLAALVNLKSDTERRLDSIWEEMQDGNRN